VTASERVKTDSDRGEFVSAAEIPDALMQRKKDKIVFSKKWA